MIKIILWLWQLPQHILALILLGILTLAKKVTTYTDGVIETRIPWINVCLGYFVFLYKDCDENTPKHEHGHSLQSLRLGPLYLLIIGLPSLAGNVWDRVFHKDWPAEKREQWYYSRPWEKQADRLGGVVRG